MEQDLKFFEKALQSIVDKFREEISGIRTNRPSTKLLEEIKVDYFGQMLPVKQLASLSVVPPREINVTAWDPTSVAAIAKAIEGVHMGLSISVDGGTVRVNLPPMSDERRKEMIKIAKSISEKDKISVRLLRDDVNKKAKASPDEDMGRFMQ